MNCRFTVRHKHGEVSVKWVRGTLTKTGSFLYASVYAGMFPSVN